MEFENYYIIDSWRYANLYAIEELKSVKMILKRLPQKVFVPLKNWLYVYKLHGVCSKWYFHSVEITKVEVHDIHFLKNIKQKMDDCVLLDDKGYLSESIQLDFF